MARRTRNPVSRQRALERLERLHQAVSRSVGRKKPPSARAVAIEKAYQRAVSRLEWARRTNPVAKARRRKKGKSPRRTRGSRSAAHQAEFSYGPKGGTRPKARRRKKTSAAAAGAQHDAHVRSYESRPYDAHEQSYRESIADRAYRRSLAAQKAARTRRRKARSAPAPSKRRKRKTTSTRPTAKRGGKAASTRKGSSRRKGRKITATLRRKMRAGLRKYWARQRKLGGAPARLRRKLSAAVKAHPPLSAAEKAFRRTNPRRRKRRNPSALIVNPRRRPPAMKRRRRRNPGLGGVAMQVMNAAVPALATAAALGALDVKVLSDKPKIFGVLAKVGVGVGALIGLKGNMQKYALPIACAAFASIGTDLGTKLMGGVVGGSKEATAKEMATMAGEDEETFGVLLSELQGMGILAVEGVAAPDGVDFAGTEPLDVGDF